MTIALDHVLVPTRDKLAAAKLLAELLGVPWAEQGIGPFAPVYVNDGLTLDFDQDDSFSPRHYAFKVSEAEFDQIFARIVAAELKYGSGPFAAEDMQINHWSGGRGVYFEDPDGHLLEISEVR